MALAIHGVRLTLSHDSSSPASRAVGFLAEDFQAWDGVARGKGTVHLTLNASAFTKARRSKLPRLFATRMGSAFGVGTRRCIDYGKGTVALLNATDSLNLSAEIYSPDAELLYEIAYSAALSLTGELLDVSGLHRVHALGLSVRGQNAICLFDESGGKSTLAMALRLKFPGEVRFFSDETPLLRGSRILSHPNRLALGQASVALLGAALKQPGRIFKRRQFAEKRLYPWQATEIASEGKIDFILLDGGRDHASASLSRASSLAALAALTKSMVVGVGVAQMSEYLLRFNPRHLQRLGGIAVSRAATAVRAAGAAQAHVFCRTANPYQNAEALLDFLNTSAGRNLAKGNSQE